MGKSGNPLGKSKKKDFVSLFVDFGPFAQIGVLLGNLWATPSLVKEFVSLGSGLLRGMVAHVGSSFVIDDLWQ